MGKNFIYLYFKLLFTSYYLNLLRCNTRIYLSILKLKGVKEKHTYVEIKYCHILLFILPGEMPLIKMLNGYAKYAWWSHLEKQFNLPLFELLIPITGAFGINYFFLFGSSEQNKALIHRKWAEFKRQQQSETFRRITKPFRERASLIMNTIAN